ncbi:PREDICTED: uncharacterized protein LOC102007836 [Chinchilla lanigera]|uniref:uncharacterized protein LOC102007836 n=1 Tax=Chinchilla lanigera TaxID=34839 RepID=UPI00038EC45A|nr:PREDICTED: uncharacterized protein LOC102007836 [Chinchilla lanigera]
MGHHAWLKSYFFSDRLAQKSSKSFLPGLGPAFGPNPHRALLGASHPAEPWAPCQLPAFGGGPSAGPGAPRLAARPERWARVLPQDKAGGEVHSLPLRLGFTLLPGQRSCCGTWEPDAWEMTEADTAESFRVTLKTARGRERLGTLPPQTYRKQTGKRNTIRQDKEHMPRRDTQIRTAAASGRPILYMHGSAGSDPRALPPSHSPALSGQPCRHFRCYCHPNWTERFPTFSSVQGRGPAQPGPSDPLVLLPCCQSFPI